MLVLASIYIIQYNTSVLLTIINILTIYTLYIALPKDPIVEGKAFLLLGGLKLVHMHYSLGLSGTIKKSVPVC